MKKLFTLLASLLFTVGIFSQAPAKMSYQAVVRNAGGTLIQNSNIGIKISLLKGTSSGAVVYAETATTLSNSNGLINIAIGTGTVTTGTFSAIDWANGPYFVKTEIDPSGGTNYSISGTTELMSVPYALFSANGTPGPQGPAGILTPGAAAGNTPYWNGSSWVTNSSSIFNNGSNIGIGTITPGFPLNFGSTIGDKISLYGNTGNHYGFGIQGGLLQIYTDASAANIAFGYGSSSSFTERARIINSGMDGMVLSGRLHIKNGSVPNNQTQSGGVWLYKADNTATLGFVGTQNNQNIGFYGGTGGWGFTYNALNSRVGIGNENPNAPLAFGASLGKKITLYPGATGDVGFAVAGNRLQIYSDNPNADVAFGYDAAGTFNERFAVKPNGALAVNGSLGAPGQVLQSNGNGAAATWVAKPYVFAFNQSGAAELTGGTPLTVALPGLDNQGITLTQASTIVFNLDMNAHSIHPLNIAYIYSEVQIIDAGGQTVGFARSYDSSPSFRKISMNAVGAATLGAGFYTTRVVLGKLDALSGIARSEAEGRLIIQVFPH